MRNPVGIGDAWRPRRNAGRGLYVDPGTLVESSRGTMSAGILHLLVTDGTASRCEIEQGPKWFDRPEVARILAGIGAARELIRWPSAA